MFITTPLYLPSPFCSWIINYGNKSTSYTEHTGLVLQQPYFALKSMLVQSSLYPLVLSQVFCHFITRNTCPPVSNNMLFIATWDLTRSTFYIHTCSNILFLAVYAFSMTIGVSLQFPSHLSEPSPKFPFMSIFTPMITPKQSRLFFLKSCN